jgi:hypothetical protein
MSAKRRVGEEQMKQGVHLCRISDAGKQATSIPVRHRPGQKRAR